MLTSRVQEVEPAVFIREFNSRTNQEGKHRFWYTDVPEVGRCLKMAPLRVYHMTK